MNSLLGFLRDVFNLGRLGMAPLTISLTAAGYYLTAVEGKSDHLATIMAMGICAHYFGFGLNDIIDRNVDQHSPARQNSPLVHGAFPLWLAYTIVLMQIPLAFFLYTLTRPAPVGYIILACSVLASIVYNLWSKTGNVPRLLAEVSLAASIGTLTLTATLHDGNSISLINLVASFAVMFVLLDLNSISSGLKDLAADLKAGAASFVISLGASIDHSGIIHLPRRVTSYAIVIHFLAGATIILLGYFLKVQWFFWIIAGIAFFYSSMHLRLMLKQASYASLQRSSPILGGYYLYFAYLIMIFAELPFLFKVLIIIMGLVLISFPIRLMIKVARKGFILINK